MTGRGSAYAYRLKDGSRRWAFVFDGPRRSDGSRNQIARKGFRTRADALAELDRMRPKYQRVTDPSSAGLGDYLEDWVNQRHAIGSIKPATASQYQGALGMLGDGLAAVPLMKLTAADLDRRYAQLSSEGGRDGEGRSPSTVRKLHAVVRKALADATRKGLIPVNVADAADPPSSSAARPQERQVWTTEQGLAFLRWKHLSGEDQALAYLTMSAGLRRAELAGLRWSDLHGADVHVTRTIAEAPDGSFVEGQPKTARGRRTVTLTEEALRVLECWRREQRKLYMATGSRPDGDPVLVSSTDVQPMTPDQLTYRWRRMVGQAVRAGIVSHAMTLHDGRHWFGSRLVEAGVDLRTVSDLMGHADPAFTLRVYAHSDDQRRRAAAIALAGLG